MPIIMLNLNDDQETEIWINSDHIIHMRRNDSFTTITLTGRGDGKFHVAAVIQHPQAIVGRIKEGYDGTQD